MKRLGNNVIQMLVNPIVFTARTALSMASQVHRLWEFGTTCPPLFVATPALAIQQPTANRFLTALVKPINDVQGSGTPFT